jgi:outer membrane protein
MTFHIAPPKAQTLRRAVASKGKPLAARATTRTRREEVPTMRSKPALLLAAGLLLAVGPAGAQTPAPAPRTLALREAIALALSDGTTARLAAQGPAEAEARRRIARAATLPTVDLGASESQTRENLKAIGFNFPGLPSLIGPYGTFEAHVRAAVAIVDLSARRRASAGRQGVLAAEATQAASDDDAAAAVATLYVALESAEANVHTAEANLALFGDLRQLAIDQWRHGVATRLDSLRAELRWSRQEQTVIQNRAQRDFARFALLHATGLSGDTPLTVADTLRDDETPAPQVEDALARAHRRPEYRALDAEVRAAELNASAFAAARWPRLGVAAQGMLNGPDPSDLEPVHVLEASLTMPLFDGGRIAGETAVARVELERARIRRADLDREVDEQVRHALAALTSAEERVRVSRQAESVGLEELRVARNRFASGVSTDLEVDNAQTSLATAREDRVRALADLAQARFDLARATGAIADLERATP